MATTYTAAKVASSVQSRAGLDATWVWGVYEAAVALVINDVIQMVKVPKYATILEIILACDDLDGGTTITLDVGDGSSTARFISASTIGQAGGVVRLGQGITGSAAADCLHYQYTAEDTVDVLVHAAPTSSGVGTVKLGVAYSLNQ